MGNRRSASWAALLVLCALPAFLAILVLVSPIVTDPVVLFGGFAHDLKASWLPGFGTIDPNMGYTSYALGTRAALDIVAGQLPLWNPYEGLGMPLLGEMQGAAMFPPTLLLLLPHGQVIEQAFLQIVAGIGTFLFLRRLGLGVAAALAGGILFEFNGVFALLRNAIFNPVAFLPWLFYAAETLFDFAGAGVSMRGRLRTIALGAVAAALAVYAGFPEVVYYYCLPLFAWIAFRLVSLPWRPGLVYLLDLAIMGGLALLLALPLLLAFGHFITAAELGGHQNAGFQGAFQSKEALVGYLLPYLYGPISFTSNPVAGTVWAHGGYIGMSAVILALGGVAAAWRWPAVWILALYAGVAVAVTHGLPVLTYAFRHIPLTDIAPFGRYLDAGWVFCVAVLAAIFIDRAATLPQRTVRGAGLVALGVGLLLLAAALVPAGPVIGELWHARQGYRTFLVASFVVAALVAIGIAAALWRRRPKRRQAVLMTVASIEAVLLFALPFASNPSAGRADAALIGFLRDHLGMQRMAIVSGNGLGPNFGSALGIASINYDDLPVPLRTRDFIHANIDPDANPNLFHPNIYDGIVTSEQRRTVFWDHLQGYQRAGVSYVLAEPDFFHAAAYRWRDGPARAVPLSASESVTLEAPRPRGAEEVAAILVTIGTYGGQSDGFLDARLCQGDRCVQASANLADAADNAAFRIEFVSPLAMTDASYRLTLSKRGGIHQVALWAMPAAAEGSAIGTGLPGLRNDLPQVRFVTNAPSPMAVTPTTAIFALEGVRPYVSAPGCRVDATTRERLNVDCDGPSRLTRLELFMEGWTARVNGTAVRVDPAEDTFQQIDLPAGRSAIEFTYSPTGVRPAMWVAAVTLVGLALMAVFGRRRPGTVA